MSRDLATIAEEALKLPQNEQLKLARTLLEKNEASGDQRQTQRGNKKSSGEFN